MRRPNKGSFTSQILQLSRIVLLVCNLYLKNKVVSTSWRAVEVADRRRVWWVRDHPRLYTTKCRSPCLDKQEPQDAASMFKQVVAQNVTEGL